MSTAKAAILAVHPDAKITERALNEYPITVKILTEDGTVVFTTDQRNLFGKNAQRRKDSIEKIKEVVGGL